MFLQIVNPSSDLEGMFWWMVIITVIVALFLALIRSLLTSLVQYLAVKKEDAKQEVRKASILFFFFVIGLILLFARESIATYVQQDVGEVAFVGLMVILGSLLLVGLSYRETTGKVITKIRKN